MSYTQTLTITIPSNLYEIGCAIGRALDPDTGGHLSYGSKTRVNEDNVEYIPETYSTSTPCTFEFYENAFIFLSIPSVLHNLVANDYEARWPDLTPPTMEEVELFCSQVILE